jgi:hypothetical protein
MQPDPPLTSNGGIIEPFHWKQPPAGDNGSGHLRKSIPAIKAAMCGNDLSQQIVHLFLL